MLKCSCGGQVVVCDSTGDREKYECVECDKVGYMDLKSGDKSGCLVSSF